MNGWKSTTKHILTQNQSLGAAQLSLHLRLWFFLYKTSSLSHKPPYAIVVQSLLLSFFKLNKNISKAIIQIIK